MLISKELYNQICQVMPIPCIDLRVVDECGQILLVKRKNEPMRGEWWFPGGRVHYKETRAKASIRKLKEECGLEPLRIREIGTFDVIFDLASDNLPNHGITTLFEILIQDSSSLKLDDQSIGADWRTAQKWQSEQLHEFIRTGIALP